ncbi:MAG: ABC transporter ATP-binding protein [Anaerolineae bacterium]|nr:ABC transporter ATP-binding protein [Anaerolineae bacterium]
MDKMASPYALECRAISKRFGAVRAVETLSLRLRPGAFLALLGPSGCGKTTLLRLIAGFEMPDVGAIVVNGQAVFDADSGLNLPPDRRRVGMVFQEYALFPHMDVAANVGYGLPRGNGRARRVDEALALVGLEGLHRRMPHELSGGQQQRVALARALAPRPDVVLLDEPFSNLDAGLRAHVRAEVRDILRAARVTTVFVTHDQEEALSLADEVAVMMGGRLLQAARPDALYRQPATREVAAFVGEANFLPGEADGTRAICALGAAGLVAHTAPGPVEVVLRPEDLELIADGEGAGVVCAREYFGHDQLVSVRLDDGARVWVRLGPSEAFAVGARVGVRVRESAQVQVFPR